MDVRAAPGFEFGGAGITVANGSVWVVEVGGGQTCCHAFVTRIGASTNEVTDEIELPGGRDLGNYAFDPHTQTIWVQHHEDSVSRLEIVVSPSYVPD